MDSQAFAQLLGNYGAFVGAIAVVATLLYLAAQVRQNARATEYSVLQGIEAGISSVMGTWTNDVGKAELISRAFEAYEDLQPDEMAWVSLTLMRGLLVWDATYWAHRNGVLPSEVWEREKQVLEIWVNSAAGRTAMSRQPLTASFRDFVDRELRKPPASNRESSAPGPKQ